MIHDRTTGRTIEPVALAPTATKPLRIELLVRNPAGTKLGDHSPVLTADDALDLVAQITELVAGDVAGAAGVTSMLLAHGVIEQPDHTPTTEPSASKPAPRRLGHLTMHQGDQP